MLKKVFLPAVCICAALMSGALLPLTAGADSSAGGNGVTLEDQYRDISQFAVEIEDKTFYYTGEEITPQVSVFSDENEMMIPGTDYSVSYRNNIQAGMAKIIIEGKGSFSGVIEKSFDILPAEITPSISLLGTYPYTGSAVTPVPEISFKGKALANGIDYDLSYSNNVRIGTAQITITLKGNYKGSFTRSFAIALAAPQVKTEYNKTTNAVRIFWERSPGASGYTVYRLNGGSWKALADITAPDTTEYRDGGLSSGATYTYKIKAYTSYGGKTYRSEYSTAIYADTKIGKVSAKTAYTCTTNAVRLNWKKVNGATGYAIYSYDPIAKKSTEIAAVNGGDITTYRLSGLDSGTQYKYKVRAFNTAGGKKYWGDHSAVIHTATKADKVTMTSASKSLNAVRLNWNAVNGNGYKIYMLVNGKWKLAETIRDASVTTWRFSGLDSGVTYSFRIRAYRTDGKGKANYGEYSSAKKVTTKCIDKLFYIKSGAVVYDKKSRSVGSVAAGSYYSGFYDSSYPDYVVINYKSEKYLVKKSNVTERTKAKILQTGAIGQMGGSIYGYSACGPTAAAILVNSQKNESWSKDDLILYAERNGLNDQGSLRFLGGITAPNLIKLINGYSNGKYTAQNIYGSDPTGILKKQIDSGNRAIVVVQYTSQIVTHYSSATHFVVICGYEYIDGYLYFYYADPFYGNGPRSLLRVNAATLSSSMSMVRKEPRCIITLK